MAKGHDICNSDGLGKQCIYGRKKADFYHLVNLDRRWKSFYAILATSLRSLRLIQNFKRFKEMLKQTTTHIHTHRHRELVVSNLNKANSKILKSEIHTNRWAGEYKNVFSQQICYGNHLIIIQY